MKKLRFLIASGPTQEPIDPVRFISNYSTGVMGNYLAQAAKKRGHRVAWVKCPAEARTARELERKLRGLLPKKDVLVMAAAICDARPRFFSRTKIKKDALRTIPLVKNPDILAGLARKKKREQVFIGFGLESTNLVASGFRKLVKKGLDLIVLQNVRKGDTPFGEKAVQALVLGRDRAIRRFGRVSKSKLSGYLVREAEKLSAEKLKRE